MIETNIDDMSGELYSYLMERLFEQGALDVTYQAISMKKNRPGTLVSVLAKSHDLRQLEELFLLETTTFGVRKYPVERRILDRTFENHKTEYGEMIFKKGYLNGELVKVTPEYESLKALAKQHNIPLRKLYDYAQAYITKEIF